MQKNAIAEFRSRILAELQSLEDGDVSSLEERAPVALDQQSVGRLSRMDALQRQALAQATKRRREVRQQRLRAALIRIEQEDFGYCDGCGDEIAVTRLQLDATLITCIECAADG